MEFGGKSKSSDGVWVLVKVKVKDEFVGFNKRQLWSGSLLFYLASTDLLGLF